MTNFEWIKGMGAEQLTNFMIDLLNIASQCDLCILGDENTCEGACWEGVKGWLEAEHKYGLEPCPFCGSDDTETIGVFDVANGYRIRCRNCGSMTGVADGEDAAVEFWNERI